MAESSALLRSVVRGDIPPTAVERLGVRLTGSPGERRLDVPSGLPTVRVPSSSLAYGLLAAWARGGDVSRLWADLLLMLDNIEFESDSSPETESLVEALWQLSAGETLDDETLTRARALAQ